MNRTKIEWTDYSWNPITGCSRRCPHCYAWAMSKRLRGRYGYPEDDPFKVTFHPDRLNAPYKLKKPSKIFVCSMGEIFDKESHYGWIELIFASIKRNPQHTFQILTQCSEPLDQFLFPENCWVGVTVKNDDEVYRIGELTLVEGESDHIVKFVSFEPLLERVVPWLQGIDWVIIGAKTGHKPFKPPKDWIQTIIDNARHFGCAIFLKENLGWSEKIQEFPKGGMAVG